VRQHVERVAADAFAHERKTALKLSYFLLVESVVDFRDALDARKLGGEFPFERIPFAGAAPFDGEVYFQFNRESSPKWLTFLGGHVSLGENRPKNQTNAALILLRVDDKVFAVTLGFGYHALDDSKVERDFGFVCSLNATDRNNLRAIDSRNIDFLTKQRRTFTSQSTDLAEFGFDEFGDVLHKVSGTPRDPNLGKTLSGSDAASLNADVEFRTLPQKCTELLRTFRDPEASTLRDLASRVAHVREKHLQVALDDLLAAAIRAENPHRLSISLDSAEWERCASVRVFKGGQGEEDDDLTTELLFRFRREHLPDFEAEHLTKVQVLAKDEHDNAIGKARPLSRLLSFETDHNGERFVFSLGRWYRVARGFMNEVADYLAQIPVVADAAFLPDWADGQSEEDYNAGAAASHGYTLLDQVNFRPGGASQIEVCDLLSPDGRFVCVKKLSKAASLSHLYAQGSVSASLLFEDQRYRDYIEGQVPAGWVIPNAADATGRERTTFVYAIATPRPGNLADILPFFSKVNLRNHARTIRRMGFRIALRKIAVV